MPPSSAPLRSMPAGVVAVVAVDVVRPPPRRAPRVRRRSANSTRSTTVIVRITNTGSELVPSDGKGEKKGENDDDTKPLLLDDDFIDLGPQYQVPDPEKGPLEQRVGVQYLDALFSDDISEEDASYWFTAPKEGTWNTERRVLRKAVPIECPPVPQGLRPADEPGAGGRRDLLSMRVGEVLDGKVVGGSYTTGLHVDVGCRYDGLIPISAADHGPWKRLRRGPSSEGGINVGDDVRVRVGKVIYAPLCRFPLVLELLDRPELDGAFADPKAYGGAFDLRGAPDSSDNGLNGVELAAAMDALTGGAWSGGAACEVTAVPSRGYSQENVVAEEREWLEEEVERWQQKKKSEVAAANAAAAAAAAARARSAAASSRSSSEEESDEGSGGEEGEESDGGGGEGAAPDDLDDDEGELGGMAMFVDECGHTDLDAAIARLF